MSFLGGASLLLVMCSSAAPSPLVQVGQLKQQVIYGEDDRLEARGYPDPVFSELATEVVGALIPREELAAGDDCDWELAHSPLSEQRSLCSGEPFVEQNSISRCTATLVGPDTIVTAGHCISRAALEELVFVRGYALGGAYPGVPVDHVHNLVSVLAQVDGDIVSESADDFAMVRIETGVELPFIALSTVPLNLSLGEPLVVIGTPEGLPMKVDAGGRIWDVSSDDYFEVTTDTFTGSSGSPVFTPQAQFIGILVGGGRDYEPLDGEDGCIRRRYLAEPEARAELVVRAEVLQGWLPEDTMSDHRARTVTLSCPTPESSIAAIDAGTGASARSAGANTCATVGWSPHTFDGKSYALLLMVLVGFAAHRRACREM